MNTQYSASGASTLKRALLCTTLLALTAVGGVAHAQASSTPPSVPPPPTRDAPAAPEQGLQLQTIVVTARRTQENLQTVPLAVTALSGATLAAQNIVGPEDLNSKVPSLQIGSNSTSRDSSKYTIRGQGEQFAGSEPAVITYFDEVPTSATGPGLLFDIQDLQVLKGPQGTLFGRNTTGGAILVEPQHPTSQFGGYIDGTLGDYGERRFQGAVNVPIIGDMLLARFAVDVNHRDGFTKDQLTGREYDDRDYQAYRLGITFRPNSRIDNYLLLNYSTSNTHDSGVQLFSVNEAAANALSPGLGEALQGALQTQKQIGSRRVEHDLQNGFIRIRNTGITNTTTFKLTDDILIKNILGYRDFKEASINEVDGTTLPNLQDFANPYWGAGFSAEPSTSSYTEEFQLQGKSFGHRLQWLLGVYVEYQKPSSGIEQELITQFATSEADIPAATYDYQSLKRDRSRAVFGQFTYDLGDLIPHLKFTGGIRYTADWRSQTASNYPYFSGCQFSAANGLGYCNEHLTASFHAPSGQMSLDYQLTPRTLFYVATRRGYKSGGFNDTAPSADERTFQPEYVTDVEIGAKTDFRLAGVKGRLNGDLFRGMFSDLQENGDLFANGQELTITANAGSGVIQGLELEGELIPTHNIEISGFYDYTDAYYEKNEFGGQNLQGIPFSNTPTNKFSLTGRYIFDTPERIGQMSIAATYAYQTRVYFDIPLIAVDTDPQRGQAGYGLLNLHADWTGAFGYPVDISAFATNLTNKTYKIFENDSYNTIGYSSGIFGEPRMFGFEARYHFGG